MHFALRRTLGRMGGTKRTCEKQDEEESMKVGLRRKYALCLKKDIRKNGRTKRTCEKQDEEESMKVGLRRKYALCRSMWSVGLETIPAGHHHLFLTLPDFRDWRLSISVYSYYYYYYYVIIIIELFLCIDLYNVCIGFSIIGIY